MNFRLIIKHYLVALHLGRLIVGLSAMLVGVPYLYFYLAALWQKIMCLRRSLSKVRIWYCLGVM